MHGAGQGLALAVAVAASTVPARAQDSGVVAVSVVRSYRPAGAQTLVDVFCRVPLSLIAPGATGGGGGGGGAYRIAVVVRDSTSLQLVAQSWSREVPARLLRAPGASVPEHFAFAARPGRYTVDVSVTDSATGRISRQQVAVEAFGRAPLASDLLLGTGVRALAGGDTTVASDEIRKGSVVVQTSGEPVLTPQTARLGYYVELYAARAETLAVTVRVLTAGGVQVIATPPETLVVSATAGGGGGGTTQGALDLAGLPPGRYQLEWRAGGPPPDSGVRRTAPFGMMGFETIERAQALAEAEPQDLFGRMTEAQLDTLYLPLVYVMASAEQGVYSALSVGGKRTWLRQFWAKRDPTPGTPRNEAQEDFYTRIAEANRRFREGGAAEIPGWRTDRGRVFIKYGPPDETLTRRQAGSTNPYEVWKYTRRRPLKYVFMDLTMFGNYALIYTDDRREPSRPNWRELLGPEAVLDVERF